MNRVHAMNEAWVQKHRDKSFSEVVALGQKIRGETLGCSVDCPVCARRSDLIHLAQTGQSTLHPHTNPLPGVRR